MTERFKSPSQELRTEAPPAERALREVGPVLAHEFNNILMGIQSYVDVIQRRMEDDTVTRAAVEISNAIRRGKELSSQILRFSHRSVLGTVPVDIAAFVRELSPEFQNVAGSGVRVEVSTDSAKIPTHADVTQLRHVLIDLVVNGAEASAPGGSVTVSIERISADKAAAAGSHLSDAAEYALLIVRDSGAGIRTEDLSQVFSPLFTTKRRHLGLGLALARQIIWDHGGDIFLKRIPTGGTAVNILLPVADEAAPAERAPRILRRIVLVEDDPVVASGIMALLELEGVKVTHVDSGAAALRAVEQGNPDAVVLDLGLPDRPGIDVYREIAKRWPLLPVVFSTGDADESRLDAYTDQAHVVFLAKPYDVETLLSSLKQAISAT